MFPLFQLRRSLVPLLVASAGLAAATAVFWHLHREENNRLKEEVRRRARTLAFSLEQNLRICDEALRSLRDLYHYSDDVTRTEFSLAASDLIARRPGVMAFFWAPKVAPDQRAAFETITRESTQTDFSIYPPPRFAPEDATPDFPILYVTPYGIAHLEGYNLRRSSSWPDLEAAVREGSPKILGRPRFLPSEIPENAVVLAAPIYLNRVPVSEKERPAALTGFILALIDPVALLEQADSLSPNHGLETLLVENNTQGSPRLLHFLAPASPAALAPSLADLAGENYFSLPIGVDGANWSLNFRPSPSWLAAEQTHRAYIIAGLIVLASALLAFYLKVLFRRTAEIEATVALRTQDLTHAQENLQEDIRRRIAVENALKLSEERYRMLVRQSTDSIGRVEFSQPIDVSLDPDTQVKQILERGKVAECNEAAARCYGAAEAQTLAGKPLREIGCISNERRVKVLSAFVRSQYHLVDFEANDPSGQGQRVFLHHLFGAVEAGLLTGIWMIERELTEQRRIEQARQDFERRLADAQRLESLGVLAGGIAHDFNNLLTGILGHANLGRLEVPAGSPLQEHFEQIESASRSAANLCQQMLAYAGKGRFVRKPENLARLAADTSPLLQASVSKQSVLRLQLDDRLPAALVDATQIQQIIMNLVVNASESFGSGSGIITITTGVTPASGIRFDNCAVAPESLAPAYAYLQVRDTGPGMNPEVRARIFEPFFTTKFAGRGLGLAAAHGIVRRHDGALQVDSAPGAGTAVTLYLPVDGLTAEAPHPEPEAPAAWHTDGTLLIVDDEAPVRKVAERIAKSLGFSVLSAENGQQALDLFEQHRSKISLVLLDLSMPGLSGADLVRRFRATAQDVVIVVMSGYSQLPDLASLGAFEPVFLAKPFSIAQFQAALQQALPPRH